MRGGEARYLTQGAVHVDGSRATVDFRRAQARRAAYARGAVHGAGADDFLGRHPHGRGWLVAVTQLRVMSSVYWSSVVKGLYLQDAWMGLIKPFILGFVIVTIGCHVGLRTTGGTQGVGRATTNAVVASSIAVIAVDFFLTRLLISVLY